MTSFEITAAIESAAMWRALGNHQMADRWLAKAERLKGGPVEIKVKAPPRVKSPTANKTHPVCHRLRVQGAKTEADILKVCKQPTRTPAIAEAIGRNEKTTASAIARLVAKGLLRNAGKAKRAQWQAV